MGGKASSETVQNSVGEEKYVALDLQIPKIIAPSYVQLICTGIIVLSGALFVFTIWRGIYSLKSIFSVMYRLHPRHLRILMRGIN